MIEEVAMKEGMEKGKQEKAFEIAKNLLVRGISPDIIAESSGLSIDELKTLSVH
jgi:predicted transposase/invertase (TIGR01784 family)